MKVKRLEAQDVHGYLPIRIDFDSNLTFLTGLNGSGKTTALRLLMGLLAPDIDELAEVTFKVAAVTVADGSGETVIRAERSGGGLVITADRAKGRLSLDASELQLLVESRSTDEKRAPVREKLLQDAVYHEIHKISTPMFLPLDRKMRTNPFTDRHLRRLGLRAWEPRLSPDHYARQSEVAALELASSLVSAKLHAVRLAQEGLDEELRNKILLDSFSYEPTDARKSVALPNRKALEEFRRKQAAVEKAAPGLRLPVGPLRSALDSFFERMKAVVDKVESEAPRKPARITDRKESRADVPAKGQRATEPQEPDWTVFQWAMNERQASRIFRLVELLEGFVANRASLHEPIDRFLQLANSFLQETKKCLQISPHGFPEVLLNNVPPSRPITALSSGERQIVVMLAHLSLNESLADSGVFIVDEPELSLHVSWQEKFVDAILQANPNVQFILATHSPAIILDKIENCRSLS